MKLIIEGTEVEIQRCIEKLAGEKIQVVPIYPTYPITPYPVWSTPRPWESPFIDVTSTC